MDIARALIENKADMEHTNDDEVAAIFTLYQPEGPRDAAVTTAFLRMLAGYGFSGYNVQSKRGWTPLHRASAHGTGADVDLLVKWGSSPEIPNNDNWNALFIAIGYNNVDTFKRLMVDFRQEYIHLQDYHGWTMLHEAADMGNVEIISTLIRHGFDPSPPYEYASTDTGTTMLAPIEVARAAGGNALDNFIASVLLSTGIQLSIDSEDTFWPASDM